MTPEGLLLWRVKKTVSRPCRLMQVDVYINRRTMKFWNYLCAVLLLTLASTGEIFSCNFVVHQVLNNHLYKEMFTVPKGRWSS